MFSNGPRTVTTGLSLLVDAADPLSYPGSGTSWTDIVTGITGSLSGSITYASDFKGTLVVNDSSSVIIFPTSSGNFGTDSFTVELAFQPNQINGQHWLVAKNSGSFPSWGAFITGSGGSGRLTAFFNASSTISCSMSTPVGSIVTGSNYLVDINFLPNTALNTIYLNSELSGSAIPNGAGSLTATSSLFISNRNSDSSVGSPLEIFNTKLYTPRLVAGRIRQNYNTLSTRLGLPQKSFLIIQDDPLLDLYPGAAAAYSLRLLNSSYRGSAIRVRRSSDNTEQDIGFTTGGGIDTTSLLSFVGAGNGFVTTWYDQSGNGNNATQSTAANQPQIYSSLQGSVILENNKPAISFDGSNDILAAVDSATLDISGSLGIFAVVSTNDGTGAIVGKNQDIFGTTSNKSYGLGLFENVLYFQLSNGVNGTSTSPSYVSYLNNIPHLLSSIYVSSSISNNVVQNIDGTLAQQITATPISLQNLSNPLEIGGSNVYYLNGRIQEIIIYNSNQSANRTGIESNINSYYQIY